MSDGLEVNRSRLAWLVVSGLMLGIVLTFFVAFVGTFVLGLFFYYAVRPLYRRVHDRIRSRGIAASMTLLAVVVPGVALVSYAGLLAFQELVAFSGPQLTNAVVERLPADPRTLFVPADDPADVASRLEGIQRLRDYLRTGLTGLSVLANGLLHLTLASVFAFFLLRDGYRLDRWFRNGIAGEGSAAYTYLRTVDLELQTVYFGNVLTVLFVTLTAILLYNGFNLVVPPDVRLPAPTLLGLLTGMATFIPLVVGKVVYVPIAGYLFWEASRLPAVSLWIPILFVLASFVLLDFLPQTIIRPYISGWTLHTGLILFSYVLGAVFFGWYGLFLGPLLAVLVVHFAKIVLPEVIHGDPIKPANRSPIDIGIDPRIDVVSGSSPSESTPESGDPEGEVSAPSDEDQSVD